MNMSSDFSVPSAGPSTNEEAIARLEEAEHDIENGDVYDWEEVMAETGQRIRLYETSIY